MKKTLLHCFGILGIAALFIAFTGCQDQPTTPRRNQAILDMKRATDHHSFSKPEEAVVTHLDWNASIDFDTRVIAATARYAIQTSEGAKRILFDVVDLNILDVTVDGQVVEWALGPKQDFIGQPLSIPIGESSQEVSIRYESAPDAGALLWVEGEQPFLFTQSQAILARTWIPCQDSPGIRFTYNAHVQVPVGTMALMSATNPTEQASMDIMTLRWNNRFHPICSPSQSAMSNFGRSVPTRVSMPFLN